MTRNEFTVLLMSIFSIRPSRTIGQRDLKQSVRSKGRSGRVPVAGEVVLIPGRGAVDAPEAAVERRERRQQQGEGEEGTPQGGCISPLLSNIYLNPLDHLMAKRGFEMVRYADDFVIMCRSPEDATRALALVQEWTAEAGLQLHSTKTKIIDAKIDTFDFLGYRFQEGTRYPRPKSMKKFKDTIRAKTKRSSGESLTKIINDLKPTLRGWFEYFKHSNWKTFRNLDGWIRMRLRSILRKRQGKEGRGRGIDHHLWPNAYFAKRGLYSLTTAHAMARQSSSR